MAAYAVLKCVANAEHFILRELFFDIHGRSGQSQFIKNDFNLFDRIIVSVFLSQPISDFFNPSAKSSHIYFVKSCQFFRRIRLNFQLSVVYLAHTPKFFPLKKDRVCFHWDYTRKNIPCQRVNIKLDYKAYNIFLICFMCYQ